MVIINSLDWEVLSQEAIQRSEKKIVEKVVELSDVQNNTNQN